MPEYKLLRLNEVIAVTRLGKTTIYGMIKNAEFPKPIRLGKRTVAWLESDIHSFVQNRISGHA